MFRFNKIYFHSQSISYLCEYIQSDRIFARLNTTKIGCINICIECQILCIHSLCFTQLSDALPYTDTLL